VVGLRAGGEAPAGAALAGGGAAKTREVAAADVEIERRKIKLGLGFSVIQPFIPPKFMLHRRI
jgi:hypothetical protein